MIDIKVKNIEEVLKAIRDLRFSSVETMEMVRKASIPLKTEIENNYTAAGHYNKKRKSGLHLVDTINTFPRKRKNDKLDPYFTYYVGPKFSKGKEKGSGVGGQQSVFIEWGTVQRLRANVGRGGIGGSRKVVGEKLNTGQMFENGRPTIGIVRKSVDNKESEIVSTLKRNAEELLIKAWNK